MPVLTTYPGVYIEEIPGGVHTIEGVATSITAFVGRTAKGLENKAVTITSYSDFERQYGGLDLRDFDVPALGAAGPLRLARCEIEWRLPTAGDLASVSRAGNAGMADFQPLQALERLLGQSATTPASAFPANSRYQTTPVWPRSPRRKAPNSSTCVGVSCRRPKRSTPLEPTPFARATGSTTWRRI